MRNIRADNIQNKNILTVDEKKLFKEYENILTDDKKFDKIFILILVAP